MRVRVAETGIMYVTNLFYHMNKLIQEDGKNRRDGDHSIVAVLVSTLYNDNTAARQHTEDRQIVLYCHTADSASSHP